MSDVELPDGWVSVELGEVAEVNGGIQKQQKRRPIENAYPFLRVANVGRGSLNLEEVHKIELFDGELDRYRLRPGDLLVVEGNGSPDQIGRAATWRGAISDTVHQNHLIRVRPSKAISARFLELIWNAPAVSQQLRIVAQSTSGLYTLSTAKVKRVRVPLPPLAEQHRIVEALEGHLSGLSRATAALRDTSARAKALKPRLMRSQFTQDNAPRVRLDQVAEVRLGRQRSPKNHSGNQMRPYLRAANVGWQGLILTNVKEMNFTDSELETYRLRKNDIVLSEASGSPGEVGKPAIWNDEIPDCCFQNTLIRVRPNNIDPHFLLYFLRCEALRGAFRQGARGVGIHHIGAAKMAGWPIPVPALTEQHRIVETLDGQLSKLDAAANVLHGPRPALHMAEVLRSSLLERAFTGQLVPQDPADEPASVLLDRIRAERAAVPKPQRTRRPRKTAVATTPAPTPTPAPRTAIQQEFEL
ncbi:restriction endonuclease subunit S [Streptomyces sp. S4.7]|uniref:restriction endonuclease subunit S n=1 Tax=Streptomyces sp. S4.7 TaxID=2705439 RepID=UPI0013DA740E|nr:restriction endonuclease subunit S [Streptomyces sp. S4.7]